MEDSKPKENTGRSRGPGAQVALECVFLAAALAAIGFFLKNTRLMTVLIPGIILLRFLLAGVKHDWIFFLIGVLGGGGNDLMSMIRGVYYYTPEHLLPVPIPIWMLIFWGQIFVAFRHLFRLPVFKGPGIEGRPWKIDKRLIADIAVLVLFRIIIYNFVRHEPVPTIGFAAVLLARMAFIPPKKHEWLLTVAVMVLGPLFEAALIAFGLYVYYDPVFLGMPAWLLIYWVFIMPLFMKGIFDRIEEPRRSEI